MTVSSPLPFISVYKISLAITSANKGKIKGIITTPWGQHCMDAVALDNPLNYAQLVLNGEMKIWVAAHDTYEV